jgi:glutamine cyclotransferase
MNYKQICLTLVTLLLFYLIIQTFQSETEVLITKTVSEELRPPLINKIINDINVKLWGYKVVKEYPHDTKAFTQGLEIYDNQLFEGTGLHSRSQLRQVNLTTGGIIRKTSLKPQYFGEGITIIGNRIYQLTWQNNIGFIYDRNTFKLIRDWKYPTEGWGLTHDEENTLILSDGSSTLYFYNSSNPQNLIRTIIVKDENGKDVINLNELEYINGEIYSNIWYSERIARIDPKTGRVNSWIDMSGLKRDGWDVLNGIAYNHNSKNLFITGKLWGGLFEVELVPKK